MIVKIAWKKRHHFDAFIHRQKVINNDKDSFDILKKQQRGYDEYKGYMDDDYRYQARYYGGEEKYDIGRNDFTSESIISICLLIGCKLCFIAMVSCGLSYIFYFVISRALKSLFSNKQQLL